MKRRVTQNSESGVAAILIVFLAIALIASAAFTVDFGIAFWNRQQLQTVTDSGSLAAADKLSEYRGTCDQVRTNWQNLNPSPTQVAYNAAVQKVGQNRWFQTVQPRQLSPSDPNDGYVGFEITCPPDGSIQVEFWADGVSPAVLGPIAGSGPVTTVAAAASQVGVPPGGFGLRPYFVCGNALQRLKDGQNQPTGWVRLQYPDPTVYDTGATRTVTGVSMTDGSPIVRTTADSFTATDVGAQVVVQGAGRNGRALNAIVLTFTGARQIVLDTNAQTTVATTTMTVTPLANGGPCFVAGGSWWTSDCPSDNNNGTLAENTARGCLTEVSKINPGTADKTNQAQMLPILQAACAATNNRPENCLGGNPGNVGSNNVVQAWDNLLGTEIALPVFNNNWQKWLFDSGYRCGQNGNNACYPIEEILAVRVCGYEWSGQRQNSSPDPECAGVANLLGTGGNDNFLYLKLKNVLVGNVGGAFECPVGDPNCDLGLRSIRLVK